MDYHYMCTKQVTFEYAMPARVFVDNVIVRSLWFRATHKRSNVSQKICIGGCLPGG